MSNIDDGGPAFPRPASQLADDSNAMPEQDGMTLRDYFAAKAIIGLLAMRAGRNEVVVLAADAYAIADAMIAERASRHEEE